MLPLLRDNEGKKLQKKPLVGAEILMEDWSCRSLSPVGEANTVAACAA
jgi:hypothetical protein